MVISPLVVLSGLTAREAKDPAIVVGFFVCLFSIFLKEARHFCRVFSIGPLSIERTILQRFL